MVLKKAACACFLGDQQDPSTGVSQRVRKKKARMEDGALETVRGKCKSYTNTNSVKGEACGFFTWKKQEIFFSDHDFFHHKFPRVHAAAPSHSLQHQLPFCES